jgi:hypothetical protein
MHPDLDFYYQEKPRLTLKLIPSHLYKIEALKIPIDSEQLHAYKFTDFKWLVEDLIVKYCSPLTEDEIKEVGGREEIQRQAGNYRREKGRSTAFNRFKLFSLEDIEAGKEFLSGKIYTYDQSFDIDLSKKELDQSPLGMLIAFQLRHLDHLMIEQQLSELYPFFGEIQFYKFMNLVIREYSGILDPSKIDTISDWLDSNNTGSSDIERLTINQAVQLFYILLLKHDAWPPGSHRVTKSDVAYLISRVTNRNKKKVLIKMNSFLEETNKNFEDLREIRKIIEPLHNKALIDIINKEIKNS